LRKSGISFYVTATNSAKCEWVSCIYVYLSVVLVYWCTVLVYWFGLTGKNKVSVDT